MLLVLLCTHMTRKLACKISHWNSKPLLRKMQKNQGLLLSSHPMCTERRAFSLRQSSFSSCLRHVAELLWSVCEISSWIVGLMLILFLVVRSFVSEMKRVVNVLSSDVSHLNPRTQWLVRQCGDWLWLTEYDDAIFHCSPCSMWVVEMCGSSSDIESRWIELSRQWRDNAKSRPRRSEVNLVGFLLFPLIRLSFFFLPGQCCQFLSAISGKVTTECV